MTCRPLSPHYGSTQQQTLAAATAVSLTISKADNEVRVWNSGSNVLYFCTYSSAGTARVASATDAFVPPNTIMTITKDQDHDRISLISPVGTTVEFHTANNGL